MDTREQIVRCADRLQRQRGYAGWSFGDVSDEVGVRRASIHHHFATKGDLLTAVVRFHQEDSRRIAAELAPLSPRVQLQTFFEGYLSLLERDLLCPCGALTIDLPLLPVEARPAVEAYLDGLRAWFSSVLAAGQAAGQVSRRSPADAQARLILATLQGALQQARALRDPALLPSVVDQLTALILVEEP